jgi:transcriptional antiterminator RfaH
MTTTERCHLIATESQRERYAAAELGQQGFATHLPLVLEPVRRGRHTRLDRRPLFPGYLFAWFDPRDAARWSVIFRTKGCIAPVRIAGALAALTAGEYAALRALESQDGVIRLDADAAAAPLTPGSRVRVTAGPWAGFLGEVLSLKGAERVRLLLGTLEVEMASRMVDRLGFEDVTVIDTHRGARIG